jgi:hypothetical protein
MSKVLCAMAIVTVLSAQTAMARHRGGCCCSGSAAPAPAAAPAAPEKAPATPAPQAQSPQATRSFSVPPSSAASQPVTGSYRYSYRAQPRIDGSYGLRPAADKMNGAY